MQNQFHHVPHWFPEGEGHLCRQDTDIYRQSNVIIMKDVSLVNVFKFSKLAEESNKKMVWGISKSFNIIFYFYDEFKREMILERLIKDRLNIIMNLMKDIILAGGYGFFVLEPEIFEYIKNDSTIWKKESMEKLTKNNQLSTFKHHGFYQHMDTTKEKNFLNKLWEIIKQNGKFSRKLSRDYE